MRIIFIFGRHTSLYPSALKISLADEACLRDLHPESVSLVMLIKLRINHYRDDYLQL